MRKCERGVVTNGEISCCARESKDPIGSQWYTKSELAPRFSFWYSGLGIAQIIGELVSFGFQHVGLGHLTSWRVMLIILGVVTVFIGPTTAADLSRFPYACEIPVRY